MDPAALSVFVFGAYIFVVGVSLMTVPNVFLPVVGLDEAEDVWVRVMGLLTVYLGVYYVMCARAGITYFFWLTVAVRCSVIVFFAAFVLFDLARWPLVLFAVVDFAGGAWTAALLRRTATSAASA